MLFEKEKYYKYIGTIENMITAYYFIIIGIFVLIGIASKNFIGFIICILIGILMSTIATLNAKIKIQEMKWKMDIYETVKKTNPGEF